MDTDSFLRSRGPSLTPEQVGEAIVELAAGTGHDEKAYLITAEGLRPAP
jgi:hypothetical protein